MAETAKNKRGRASSSKTSSAKSSKKPTRQPAAAATKTSPATVSQSKTPEVVVHKTASGPTSSLKTAGLTAINTVTTSVVNTVQQRSFWVWVGGIVAAVLVLLVAWWQWQRSYVAVVNGQYVPTTALYSQLMASGGAETLNNITQQQLILQQAQREKITVSNDEIEKELSTFKESTGGEDQYQTSLKEFGISEDLLRNQIEVRLTLEKILADKIKVSDQEIEDYYNANKAEVDVANEGLDAARSRIETQLREQKLSQESSKYIQSLQQSSTIKTLPHHASLTFSQFLSEEVWTIPSDVWELFAGSSK